MSIIRIISSLTILTLFLGAYPSQALETDAFNNSIPLSFPKIITLKEDAGKVSKKAAKIAKPTPPKRVQKIVKQRVVRYKKVVVKKKIVRGKPPAQKKPVKSIVKPAHENVELPPNTQLPQPEVNQPPSEQPAHEQEPASEIIIEPEPQQQTKEVKEIVQGELIVKFKGGTTPEQIDEVNARLNGSVKQNIAPDTYLIQINDGTSVEDKVAQYSSEAIVEYAEPNYIVKTMPVGEPVQIDENAAPKANPEPATNNLNPTASKEMFFYTGRVNYEEGDTDTTIVEDPNNANLLTNTDDELTFNVAFPRELSDEAPEAITFQLKDKEVGISFKPININKTQGMISGTSVIYKNIYEGVDLKFEVKDNSLKELLILNSKEAVRDFEFNFSVFGDVYLREEDKRINIYDKNTNEKLFSIPPIFMYDQTGLRTYNAQLRLDNSAERLKLIYILDDTWLDDPERVYPVVVDPEVYESTKVDYWGDQNDDGFGDTYIDSSSPSYVFENSQFLYVGKSPGGAVNRTILRYDLSKLAGAKIIEAKLYLYPYLQVPGYELGSVNPPDSPNTDKNHRDDLSVEVINTSYNFERVTWGTQLSLSGVAVNTTMTTFDPNNWPGYDVTAIVQAWSDQLATPGPTNYANWGFMIKAVDETNSNYFKTFLSAEADDLGPYLYIAYNNFPKVDAIAPRGDNSTTTLTTANYYPDQPTFEFNYSDKEGEKPTQAFIEIAATNDFTSVNKQIVRSFNINVDNLTGDFTTGVKITGQTPLTQKLQDGSYWWRAGATDGWLENVGDTSPKISYSIPQKFKVLSSPQISLEITDGINQAANAAFPTFKWTLADPDGDLLDSWLRYSNNPNFEDNGTDKWTREQWYFDSAPGNMNGWVNKGVSFLSTWTDWKYRKPITLTNTTGTLYDYQAVVYVDTATLISAGKMQSNGADIRFANTSGTTLPYWIESGINTTSTKIWVKVDTIAAFTNTTIYMYYGNSGAPIGSYGDSVFIFFDNFFGNSLDSTKWNSTTSGGNITVSDGNVKLTNTSNTAGSTVRISNKTGFAIPSNNARFIVEAKHYETAYYRNRFYAAKVTNGGSPTGFDYGYFVNGSTRSTSGATVYWNGWKTQSVATNTWYLTRYIITNEATNNYKWETYKFFSMDTVSGYQATVSGSTNAKFITISVTDKAYTNTYVDWVRVRQFVYNEPTYSVGAEQTHSVSLDRTTYRTQNGGSNSLKIDSFGLGAAGYSGAMRALGGTFWAGRTYTVNAYFKTASSGSAQLLIGDNDSGDFASVGVNLTSAWQLVTLSWTPSANRTSVYVGTRTTTNLTYNIEDVGVYDNTNPTLNKVPNPGFDTQISYTVPVGMTDGSYYFRLEVWDKIATSIAGWSSKWSYPSAAWSWSASTPVGGDFTGDGNDDVIIFYGPAANQTKAQLLVSNGNDTGSQTNPILLNRGVIWDSQNVTTEDKNWNNVDAKYETGDFDGDGDDEILATYNMGAGGTDFWLMDPYWSSGQNQWVGTWTKVVDTIFSYNSVKTTVGDFNGDGLSDFYVLQDAGSSSTYVKIFQSTSTSTSFSFWQRTGLQKTVGLAFSAATPLAGDYNADGKADLAIAYEYPVAKAMKIFMLTASDSGLADPVTWYYSGDNNWSASYTKYEVGDFNNDRKTDITAMYRYGLVDMKIWYFLSRGAVTITTPSPNGFAPRVWYDSDAWSWDYSKTFIANWDDNSSLDTARDPRDNLAILYSIQPPGQNEYVDLWLFKNKPFNKTRVDGAFDINFEANTSLETNFPFDGQDVAISRPAFILRAVRPDGDVDVTLQVFRVEIINDVRVETLVFEQLLPGTRGNQTVIPAFTLPDGDYVWRLTTTVSTDVYKETPKLPFRLLTKPTIKNASPRGYITENQPLFSFEYEDTNSFALRDSTVELAYDKAFKYKSGLPAFFGGRGIKDSSDATGKKYSASFTVPYALADGTYYYRITAKNEKNIESEPLIGSFSVNTAKLAAYQVGVGSSLPGATTVVVPVVVKNVGSKLIRREAVELTYRFTSNGNLYNVGQTPAPLPYDLPPGQSASFDLSIATPAVSSSALRLIVELKEKATDTYFSKYKSSRFEKSVTIQDQYDAAYSGRAPPVISSLPTSFTLPITITNKSNRTFLASNTYLSYQIFNRDGQVVADGLSTKTALGTDLVKTASRTLPLSVNISALKNNIYTLAIGLVEIDGTNTTWFSSKGVNALTYPIAIGKVGASSIPVVAGVNLATGNLSLSGTDFSLGGRGPNLSITRTYNSQDSGSTISGIGWTFNFETKLNDFGPYARILSGDGSYIYFDKLTDGSYRALEGIKLKLTKETDLTYTLEDAVKNKTYFRSNGLLDRVLDSDDNTLTFGYDASNRVSQITDATGRSISIIYDASSRVSAIAYPASNARGYTYTVYGYDATTGDLTGVLVDPTDTATGYSGLDLLTTYAYQNNKLISITSPSGISTLRYEYAPDGRVSKIIDPISTPTNIVETTFSYIDDEAKTEVTFPSGAKTTYILGRYLNLKSVIAPKVQASDPDLITDYYFDNLNNLLATDVRVGADERKGSTTIYQYDDTTDAGWANLIRTTAVDKETENYYESNTLYDENNYPILSTDSKGNRTVLYYDTSGNVLNVSDATGTTTVTNYDAYGNAIYSTEPIAPSANLIYNSNLEADTDLDSYPDGYSFFELGYSGPVSSRSTDAYSGLYSLKQTHYSTGQESYVYTSVASGSIKPYQKYVFSAWVKTVGSALNQGGVVLWASWSKNHPVTGSLVLVKDDFSRPYKTNGQWQRIYFVATAPKDATGLTLQIRQKDFIGDTYVDAISIEEANVIAPYNLVENASFEAIALSAFNWSATSLANTATYWVKKDSILESNSYQLIKFSEPAYSPDASGFIRSWLILGDFQSTYPELAYDTDYLNYEATIKPYEGMKTASKTWSAWQDADSIINFNNIIPFNFTNTEPNLAKFHKERAAYASAYIYSDSPWYGLLSMGFSDNAKVYLNGELVEGFERFGSAASLEGFANIGTTGGNVNTGVVVLKEGLNRLLIKVEDDDPTSTTDFGFSARFTDFNAVPNNNIKVYLSPLKEGTGETVSVAGDGYVKQDHNGATLRSSIYTSTASGTLVAGKQYTVSAYVRTEGFFTNFSDGTYYPFEPVNGVFRVENASLLQKNAALDTSLIVTGTPDLRNFTYEAEVVLDSGTKVASLVFGYQDKDNYYLATIDGNVNEIVFYKVVAGNKTILNNDIYLAGFSLNKTYKLKLIVRNKTFDLYLKDSFLLEAADPNYTGGRVGLSTSKTAAYFDNVRLISAGGSGGAKVVVEAKSATDTTLLNASSPYYQTNGKWQLAAFDFVAPAGARYAKISLIQENFDGSTYFDSIRIEERISNTITYDGSGNYPISTENAAGNKADVTYDNVGNVKTTTTYKKINQTDTSLTPTTVTYTYDALSRVIAVTAPTTNQTSESDYYNPTYVTAYNVYDKDGRLSAQVGVDGLIVAKSYLANGAVQSVTVGKDGQVLSQTIYEYDKAGNVTRTVNDPTGLAQETRASYDILGRLTSKTDPRGFVAGANPADYTTYYAYDIFSNLKTTTDARGYTTFFAYNGVGQKISETDAKLNTTYFVYDASGNLAAQVNPTTSTTTSRNVALRAEALPDSAYQVFPPQGATISAIASGSSIIGGVELAENIYDYKAAIDGIKTSDNYAQIYSKIGPDPYFLLTLDKTYAISAINIYLLDKNDGARSYRYKVETSVDGKNFKLAANRADRFYSGLDVIGFATPKAVKYIKVIAVEASSPETDFFQVSEIEAITPNNSVVFDYDGEDRLIAQTDAAGYTSYNYYNQSDEPAFSVDAKGYVTSYEYDNLGRPVKAIDPLGNFTRRVYDEVGNVVESYDQRGVRVASNTYDAAGALRESLNAINHKTEVIYDAAGRVRQTRDYRITNGITDLITNTNNYDTFGRPSESVDALGYRTNQVYDSLSRVVEVWDSNANFFNSTHSSSSVYQPTRTVYYADNKVNATIDPLGIIQAYGYDANGNLTTSVADYGTGKLNQTTTYAYDELNQLISVVDPRGNVSGATPSNYSTTFTYDARGNKLTMTDSKGTTRYDYDENNRLIRTIDPLNNKTDFIYDPEGMLLSASNQAGTINYTYDANNRLVSEVYSNKTITYKYDAEGRLTEVNYQGIGGQTLYSYDNDDRLTSRNQNGSTIAYEYDSTDNLTKVVDSLGNTINYVYNARGEISSITDSLGNTIASFTYDPNGNLLSKILANGITATYTYDPSNRLISIKTVSGATVLDEKVNTYDALDNLVAVSLPTPDSGLQTIVSYAYDIAEQLIEDNTYTYTYDGNGNILTKIEKATGLGISYTYNAANQLVQSVDSRLPTPDSRLFTYDDSGNMTSDGIYTYIYDAKDQLIEVRQGLNTIALYTYDSDGQRMAKSANSQTINYIYNDATNMLSAEVGLVNKAFVTDIDEYGNLISIKIGAATYYYVYDALGQIIGLTDAAGNFAVRYTYDSWGVPTEYNSSGQVVAVGTFGNPYLYKSYYYDTETGLYYLNARYYNPRSGRFITRDPDPGSDSDRLTKNSYIYVKNNPIKLDDPDGNHHRSYYWQYRYYYNLYKKEKDKKLKAYYRREYRSIKKTWSKDPNWKKWKISYWKRAVKTAKKKYGKDSYRYKKAQNILKSTLRTNKKTKISFLQRIKNAGSSAWNYVKNKVQKGAATVVRAANGVKTVGKSVVNFIRSPFSVRLDYNDNPSSETDPTAMKINEQYKNKDIRDAIKTLNTVKSGEPLVDFALRSKIKIGVGQLDKLGTNIGGAYYDNAVSKTLGDHDYGRVVVDIDRLPSNSDSQATPVSLAGIIAHELQHAIDDMNGIQDRKGSEVEIEYPAYLINAKVMNELGSENAGGWAEGNENLINNVLNKSISSGMKWLEQNRLNVD